MNIPEIVNTKFRLFIYILYRQFKIFIQTLNGIKGKAFFLCFSGLR